MWCLVFRRVLFRLLLAAPARHGPLDDDLPLHRHPREEQGGAGVGVELAALAALVIGVEDEAAAVTALEQHGAGGGPAVAAGGGPRHGVGLGGLSPPDRKRTRL